MMNLALLVITVTYASAKPNAVMIELQNAVIACMAMRAPWGSEDLAGLTKFKPVESAASYHMIIEDSH